MGKRWRKAIHIFRAQKITKPFPDYFFPLIAQHFQPLGIDLKKIAVKIQGLITQGGFGKEQFKFFLAFLKFRLNPLLFLQQPRLLEVAKA